MATMKRLQNRVDKLNKLCGFKPTSYTKLKSGRYKRNDGSGFILYPSYGKVSLNFEYRNTEQKTVSPLLSKPQLDNFITGVIQGIDFYKNKTKYKKA